MYFKGINQADVVLTLMQNISEIQINKNHVWHLFPIQHPERDKLQEYLKNEGIQTLIHYPFPPHKQPAYKEFQNISFPIAEGIHKKELSLPISQVIDKEEVNFVIKKLNKYKKGI